MKRLLSLVLALLILLQLAPWAYATGDAGDFTYKLVGDTVTITGHTGDPAILTIPDNINGIPVTAIGESAFYGRSNLTSVTFPDTLTAIGEYAFDSCINLTELALPKNLTTLGNRAFSRIPNLQSVTIPADLQETSGPFQETGLETVTFEEGTTKVADNLFQSVSGLTTLKLPETITAIGESAFWNCKSLTSLVLPEAVTAIGDNAFSGCENLQSITLSSNLTTISRAAFQNCAALTAVTLPDSITKIEDYAFDGCTGLTSLVLPKNLTTLGNRSFASISNLQSVTIPAGLQVTGGPFQESTLGTVTFEEGTTKLADKLFQSVSGLTTLELPETITAIGDDAFWNCKSLRSLVLPNSVTAIGENAFLNCENLQSITLPSNLTTISRVAFQNCTALTAVTLPDSITKIEEYAFDGCTKLTALELPENLTTLGNRSFARIPGLQSVTIPAGLQMTGGPFQDSSVETVIFAEGTTKVADKLFQSVSGLTTLELPETVTAIGDDAFWNCKSLRSLVLPEAVTAIGDNAFSGCENLQSITLSSNLKTIGYAAFSNCKALTSLHLPDGLQELGTYCFAYCAGLETVTIPNSLQVMQNNVFRDCTNLTRIYFGSAKPEIDDGAMWGFTGEIYADKSSTGAIHAIDQNLPLTLTDFSLNHTYLDSSQCRIRTTNSGGLVHVSVDFALKEAYAGTAGRMEIRIPQSASYWEATGTSLDGIVQERALYDSGEHLLTVPLTGISSGTIRFSLEPLRVGAMNFYANVYGVSGSQYQELVDLLLENMPDVTLSVPERVRTTFSVNGIAPAGETVTLTVDGAAAGTAKANLKGNWSAQLTLTDPGADYTTHTVTAGCGSTQVSETVTYVNATPTLTQLDLYYNNHKDAHVSLLENEFPVLSFNPAYPLTFVAKFADGEEIETVYVKSNRNGQVRTMEMTYDPASGCYTATGTFGNEDTYVPGAISVEYVLKQEPIAVSNLITTMTEKVESISKVDGLGSRVTVEELPMRRAVGLVSGLVPISSTKATIDISPLGNGTQSVSIIMDRYQVTSTASSIMNPTISSGSLLSNSLGLTTVYRTNSSPLSGSTAPDSKGRWIRFTAKDPETGKRYNVSYAPSDSEAGLQDYVVVVEDIAGDEVLQFAVKDIADSFHKSPDAILDAMEGVGDAAQWAGLILEANSIQSDYDEMIREIYRTVPPEQREAAIREAKRIRSGRSDHLMGTLALGMLTSYLTTAGMLTGPAGIAMAGILMAVSLSSDWFSEWSSESILEKLFNINWIVDPSGYVYEAVTTNRLSGVTATAYWIPEDGENPDFWETTPTVGLTDETVKWWDAMPYSQENPIQTDQNGCYAWDVPPGWWNVQYALNGYETTTSGWLPVPPPQLEVNVPMVSYAVPELLSVSAEPEQVQVVFSKYMKPETVQSALTLNGKAVTVTYPTHETAADGTVYARTFTLIPDTALTGGSSAVVTVSDKAESYAGTAAKAEIIETRVGSTPRLVVPESVELLSGQPVTLPVSVENLEGAEVVLTSSLSTVVYTQGMTLTGNLPGSATVTVQVTGTNLTAEVPVTVVRELTVREPKIGATNLVGDDLTVALQNCPDGYLIAAGYNGDQMLWAKVVTVTAGQTTALVEDLKPAASHRLFLLHSNYTPAAKNADF